MDLGRPGEEEDLFQKASDLAARPIPTILLVSAPNSSRKFGFVFVGGEQDRIFLLWHGSKFGNFYVSSVIRKFFFSFCSIRIDMFNFAVTGVV